MEVVTICEECNGKFPANAVCIKGTLGTNLIILIASEHVCPAMTKDNEMPLCNNCDDNFNPDEYCDECKRCLDCCICDENFGELPPEKDLKNGQT